MRCTVRSLLCILSVFIVARTVVADDSQSGIIYGSDFAYIVIAPDGWIPDDQTWASRGIHALFYQKGRSFSTAEPFMYVATARKSASGPGTLQEWIESDISATRSRDHSVVVSRVPSLTVLSQEAPVVRFDKTASSFYETVVYVEYKHVIHMIVLVCKSKELRERLAPALMQLLSEFRPMDKTP